MNNITRLRQVNAEERFRDELMTAISILARHAKEPMSDDLLEAIEDLADDLMKAVDNFRNEGRL
jgi:hypothetical protein